MKKKFYLTLKKEKENNKHELRKFTTRKESFRKKEIELRGRSDIQMNNE